MPPKRKSTSLWQTCERCKSIISFKDLEFHEEECRCPPDARKHCFILENVLYGYVDDVRTSDVTIHIKSFKDDLVFISQSALQICGFSIGCPVIISFGDETEIRRAWPSSEGSLTSICMSNTGLSWNFGQRVILKAITNDAVPVANLYYEIVDHQFPPASNLDQFHMALRHQFKDRILLNGGRVPMSYLGRTLILRIEADMETLMAGLSLTESILLLALASTSWILKKTSESTSQKNSNPLDRIAGYENVVTSLVNELSQIKSDCRRCVGVLLHGHHGVGKTHLANCLAEYLCLPKVTITGAELCGRNGSKYVREGFSKAHSSVPSVILLDSIDSLAWDGPAHLSTTSSASQTAAALVAAFDSIASLPVAVIATAVAPSSVLPALRRPNRLEGEVELEVPTAEDRQKILELCLRGNGSEFVAEAAKTAHGYVAADLAAAAAHALSAAIGCPVDANHLASAMAKTGASGMREAAVLVSPVRWEDIGGMEAAKQGLIQAAEWPLKRPEAFIRLGVVAPRGVLLFGPPGCSKTMLARALATQSGLNFISIKGSDVFSKWVGESERAVREVFARARRVAPAVVFLDEVDALAAGRGDSSSGHVGDRVLSQLLTELDGVRPLDQVLIVAATNRPDRIDRAVMRPGRLDRLVYVPLPDLDTRLAILKVKLASTPLSQDVDLVALAESTNGYSGAEITAVCNEAAMKTLEEDMESVNVAKRHFDAAINMITPRTPQSLLDIYAEYINKSTLR